MKTTQQTEVVKGKRMIDLYPYLFLIAFFECLRGELMGESIAFRVAVLAIVGVIHALHRAIDAFKESFADDDDEDEL